MPAAVRWFGIGLASLGGLLAVVIVVAAATDRPSTQPQQVDRNAPEVVAFLDAERTWMAYHGLDYVAHDVEVEDPALRVRVLEVGDGPEVLIVPGSTGEAAYYAPLLEDLDGYRFLMLNLPGGGASDGIDLRAVDHRELARETLDAVYDHFDLGAVPVVANSRGGTWALWYGLDRPERVTANVQLGPPAGLEGTEVPGVLRMLGVPGLNRLVASTLLPAASPEAAAEGYEVFGHPTETVERLPRELGELQYVEHRLPTFALSWRSLGQDSFHRAGFGGWNPELEISPEDLAELEHPTMLVWGTEDPFGDLDVARAAVDHLPDADLAVAGVGHLPWLDDPRGVSGLVADFLDAAAR